MTRMDIINHLIKRCGYQNYLEIGVRTKADCFDHIICPNKTSVDPGYENPNERIDYPLESDHFFDALQSGLTEFPKEHKWDIIFIDGLHQAEQVKRDVLNSLEHLAEGGTIVMHDCCPPHELIAREKYRPDYDVTGLWCGTVWKAFMWFRTNREDLWMRCVDDDYGVGIIRVERGGQKLAPNDNPFYEYHKFWDNREEYLHLISPEEFLWLFDEQVVRYGTNSNEV